MVRVAADDHWGVVRYDAGRDQAVPDGTRAGGRDGGVAGPDHLKAPRPATPGNGGTGPLALTV